MSSIYVLLAVSQLRAAAQHAAQAAVYVANAVQLASMAVLGADDAWVPVEEQPEYRINMWAPPGQEPQA